MGEVNLTSYREIAAGTTGAFMAPADVAVLLGAIDNAAEHLRVVQACRLAEKRLREKAEAEAARLRQALTDIKAGTALFFDEGEGCEVEVWMDADDLMEIARNALTPTPIDTDA